MNKVLDGGFKVSRVTVSSALVGASRAESLTETEQRRIDKREGKNIEMSMTALLNVQTYIRNSCAVKNVETKQALIINNRTRGVEELTLNFRLF